MYFNKKVISYCIIFETNLFIEMVICVAVTVKVMVDKGRPPLLLSSLL